MATNWSRGHRRDGNVLRDTDAQIAAKRRRMERTKCPKCGRKGAIRTYVDDYGDGSGAILRYCYWNTRSKCDWEESRPFGTPTG